MDEETIVCCVLAIIAAVPIFVLKCCNKDDTNKIQRYYYNTDRQKYLLLEISIFILTISFMFNIRIIGMYILNEVTSYFERLD